MMRCSSRTDALRGHADQPSLPGEKNSPAIKFAADACLLRIPSRIARFAKSSTPVLLAAAICAALAAFTTPAFGQTSQASFGSGVDDYWQQNSGNDASNSQTAPDGAWLDTFPGNDGSGDNWNQTYNVGTYNGSVQPPGGIQAVPTSVNDAIFNGTAGAGNGSGSSDVRLNTNATVQGIYYDNPGGGALLLTTVQAGVNGSAPESITIGSDGMTLENTYSPFIANSAESQLTIGPTTFGTPTYPAITFLLTSSQTWANYTIPTPSLATPKFMEIFANIAPAPTATTATTLTMTTGGITNYPISAVGNSGATADSWIDGTISDGGVNGTTPLAINIASGQWSVAAPVGGEFTVGTASTYSGGTTIGSTGFLKDVGASGAGTGPIYVTNGGSFGAATTTAGNTTYANPIYITGVGVTASAQSIYNGTSTTLGTGPLGAITAIYDGSSIRTDNLVDTLTGGITLTGNALITASRESLIISTNPVNLGSNTLTLGGFQAGTTTSTACIATVSSPIIGGGNIIISSGTGAQTNLTTFGANNTYTGSTTVTLGTLQVGTGGAAGTLGAGAISIASGSTLNYDMTSTQTLNQSVTNAGTLKVTAPGRVILNGTLNFSGGGTIALSGGGNLELNSYPTGMANAAITDGALADISAGPGFFTGLPSSSTPIDTYFLPLIGSPGSVGLTYSTNETIDFTTNSHLATSSLGAVGNVTYGGTFTPGTSTTYKFGGGGGTLTFNSALGNTATVLDQQASGTTILSGPNTFAGTTSVTVGNLEFNSYDSALAAGSITVTPSSGQTAAVAVGPAWLSNYVTNVNPGNTTPITSSFLPLINTSSTGSLALAANTSENLSMAGYASLSLGAIGSVNYSGTLTPNSTTYFLGGGGGTLNFSGLLADVVAGPTAVNVANSGTVYLSNTNNTYSGGTTISGSGAVLQVNSDNTTSSGSGSTSELGQVPASPALNITINGGTLQATGSFTLNSNRAIALGAGSGTGSGTIDVVGGATLTYAGTITNAGTSDSLVVTDAGTLILSGLGQYTGGTTVQNGATLRTDPATGSIGTGGVTLNAGTLSLQNSSSTALTNSVSVTNPLNVPGQTSGIDVNGTNAVTITGAVSIMNSNLNITNTGNSGPYTLTLGNAATSTVTVGGGPVTITVNNNGANVGNLYFDAALVGSGTPQITFNGGIVTLSQTAQFNIGTILNPVEEETLPIGTTVTLGPNNTTLNLNATMALDQYAQMTVDANATLSLGLNQTISSLSGAGTVNLNGSTLTIGNLDNATGSFSGTINDATAQSALVINGGSTTLTGANTFSGGTTISSGTLRIGNTTTPAGTGAAINLSGGNLSLIGAGSLLNQATQSYAYNINQSANGSINIAGSLAATVGDLTIGSNILNITSSSGTTSPYSLTFAGLSGTTTLNGNPTINVYNSTGGGTGTVTLGAFNDNGTPRTISFGGSGVVQLNSAAQLLTAPTQVTLLNGLVPGPTTPSGPVIEYKFAEGSGTTAIDSGSFGFNGGFVGSPTYTTTGAQVGPYALNLTTANSFVQIPHNSALNLSSYTVSAWVNPSQLTNTGATVFSTRNSGDTTFDIQFEQGGLHADVGNGAGTWLTTNANLGVSSFSTNTWYLVTYTVSPSGVTAYLNGGSMDGGLQSSVPYSTAGTPSLEGAGEYATIGNQMSGGVTPGSFTASTQFYGEIDDVRIYNSALSAAQVAALYDLTPAGVTVNSNNATAIGSSAALSVGNAATFNLGASQQVQTLSGTGTVALGSNTLTVGSGDPTPSTFAGVITGNGGLTINKSSTATLTLQNGPSVNNYTGPTTITSGTLAVNVVKPAPTYISVPNGNFVSPAVPSPITTSSYSYNPAGGSWTFAQETGLAAVGSAFSPDFNGATGDFQVAFMQSNTSAPDSTISQNVTLSANTTYTVSFYSEGRVGFTGDPIAVYLVPGSNNTTTSTAGTLSVSPGFITPVVGSWNESMLTVTVPSGAGGTYTLDFDGESGISNGNSFIDDVTVSTTPAYSTQVLSPTSAVVLSSSNSTLALNDNSQTIGSLTGLGNVLLGSLSTTTLTVGADGTTPAPFTGLISGAGGVTVIGGTLTLGSSNSYGGTTNVNGGTLLIANGSVFSGSATGTGPVNVNNGGTLAVTVAGGNGSIVPTGVNTVTVNSGGTLALANGVTMTLGNGLTLSPGAITSADLSGMPNGIGSSSPLLAIPAGNFVITSGTDDINLVGTPSAGAYDLISYSGATVGGAGTLAVGTAPPGFSYVLTNNVGQMEWDLTVTPGLVWTGVNADGSTVNGSWDTTHGSTNWSDGGVANFYSEGRAVIFGDTNPITTNPVSTSNVTIQTGGVNPYSVLFTNNSVDYMFSNVGGDSAGISGSAFIVMEGTGNVTFQSANSFTGSVAINDGQLIVENGGALGSSSGVTVASGAALQLNGGINVSNSIPLTISGTGIGGNGALVSAGGSNTYAGPITLAASATINSDPVVTSTLTLSGGINVGSNVLTFIGSGNTTENGNLTIGAGGSIVANGTGVVTFSVSTGASINATNGGVSVSPGATVLLAGSTSDFSDASAPSHVLNVANNGTLTVSGTNQVVGTVTGTTSSSNGAEVANGATNVGTGASAGLTAAQIVQSSVAIGANSTLVIEPASTSMMAVSTASSAGAVASSSSSSASSDSSSAGSSDSSSDPLAVIQAAESSGEITSSTAEALDNKIAIIDQLAATDPRINVAMMDGYVLSEIPMFSVSSDSSSTLSLDGSSIGSGSGSSLGLSSDGIVGGSTAAVPEPSTLLLTALGGLGIAFALRRRRVCHS